MRVFFVVCAAVASHIALLAQQPPQPTGGTIRGAVFDQKSQPAVGTSVVIFPADASEWPSAASRGAMQRTAVANGSYVATNLPAGNYKVAVAGEAAVAAFPDLQVLQSLSKIGLPVQLAPGEQVTINFFVTIADGSVSLTTASVSRTQLVGPTPGRMGPPPGAVLRPEGVPGSSGAISGTISDEDGKPVAGVTVLALRRLSGRPGVSVPIPMPIGRGTQTDQAGQYRLGNQAPGLVLVVALATPLDLTAPGLISQHKMPLPVRAADGTTRGYVTTYFPGVTSQAMARTVVVDRNEVTEIDFRLARATVVTLTGQVVSSSPGPQFGQMATLLPADIAEHLGGQNIQRAMVDGAGHFSFDQVALGRYVVTLNAGSRGWARLPIDVTASSSAVTLTLQPPLSLSGHVEIAGVAEGSTPPGLAKLGVALEARPLLSGSSRPMAAVAADGTFTIPNIPAGPYALRLIGPATVTQISGFINGRDSLDAAADITADVTDAKVLLSPRTAAVLVTVRDDVGQPVGDGVAVLFSDDKQYWDMPSRRLQVIRVTPSGTFTASALPPGKYYVVAGRDLPVNPRISPQWIESLIPRATAFDIGIGENKTLQMQQKAP